MSTSTPPIPAPGAGMWLNSPLGAATLNALVARALAGPAPSGPRRIVDLGCGAGEVLLRLLAANDHATGVGIDLSADEISRAGAAAAKRNLADRAEFVVGDAAATATEPADLLVSLGSYQAFGDVAAAASALHTRTAPGGRALLGVEFWAHPPSREQLAAMWEGTTTDDALELPVLVEILAAAGWRPLHLHESSQAEWDSFEFAHTAAREEWLAAHRSEPGADMLRRQLDAAHQRYLCGHRGVMGFATLLLTRP